MWYNKNMSTKHKIAQYVLGGLARRIIKKYQPRIVGITGSVGKTTTKEAIALVLAERFSVRKNERNHNTEIGVPLTVIGCAEQPRSFAHWIGVLGRAFWLLVHTEKNFPTVLVLEMGADHPGDIAALTRMAPCDVGVITAVGPTHLEYFQTVEEVQREKSILVSHLRPAGTAILNHDDRLVYPLRQKTRAKVMTYGFAPDAEVRARDYQMNIDPWLHDPDARVVGGSVFKIAARGAVVPVGLQGVVGTPPVYAALAAAAAGLVMGVNLHAIAERLGRLQPMPGRLSLIKGIKRTLLIDDTYNASPTATAEALAVLGALVPPDRRSWAVLGDMLELGAFTAQAHREVGAAVVAKAHAQFLVTVGERARDTARAAIAAGMRADAVSTFAHAEEAGRFIQNKLGEGDILLIKGSRGMHMEIIVRELMAEPLRTDELLVSTH